MNVRSSPCWGIDSGSSGIGIRLWLFWGIGLVVGFPPPLLRMGGIGVLTCGEIDVDETVNKVQKEVDVLEEKLMRVVAVEEESKTEEGTSVMDIQEELDDEGNVLSECLARIGEGNEALTEVDAWVNGKDPGAVNRKIDPDELKGLAKLMDETEKEKEAAERKSKPMAEKAPSREECAKNASKDISPKAPQIAPPPKDTNEALHTPEPSASVALPKEDTSRVRELGVKEEDSDKEEEGGGYVRVIDDPEEPKPEDWVQEVAGEEEEDAKLRREMLNYNMQEIGAVVAEINLEEDGDYYGYEDYSDEDDDEESEEEDKYGRTTRRVVTESYRKEMEELQRRMLAREGKLLPEEKPPVPGKKKVAGKKGVRFAEELDIAPSAPPDLAARLPAQPVEVPPGQIDIAPDENNALPFIAELLERQMVNAGPIPSKPIPLATGPESVEKPEPKEKVSLFKKEKLSRAPSSLRNEIIAETPAEKEVEAPVKEKVVPASALSESVLERTPGAPTIAVQAPNMQKISRFKAAKMAKPEEGDESDKPQLTMSNFIVEHDPAVLATGAKPPDELDPDLHRQEVAANFHRLRTKMIQQQGGFIESDEDRAIVPLNEDGGKQKISRFKAARLKGLGA
jgi:unconventional prefoldin RPB5 interactor 1